MDYAQTGRNSENLCAGAKMIGFDRSLINPILARCWLHENTPTSKAMRATQR